MIEVRVRLITDAIAETGAIIPKHCWSSGAIRVVPNAAHGIKSADPLMFNSIPEMIAKFEALLIEHGITMHAGHRERRYRA